MSIIDLIDTEYKVLNGVKQKLTTHPELNSRYHISSGNDQISAGLEDFEDFAKVYRVYTWVNKAVKKSAEQIAPLKVEVVDQEGEAIQGHPLTMLFSGVNPDSSGSELWHAWVVNMLLAGDAPVEIVDSGGGMPVELWSRRPDLLGVIPDVSNELFPRVAGYTWGTDENMVPRENMWHPKFYNPLNAWRGLPPIAAVREGITIDMFSQAWSKRFLQNSARPDFAIIAPDGLTIGEREEIELQFLQKHQGPDNWHKPVTLENITKIEMLNFAPKDIEWLEQRKVSRDEVGAIFGMPDEIMGFGRDTYENFGTAWRIWWLLALKPLTDFRDESLTKFFTKTRPILRPGELIKTDLSGIGALQEDLTDKIDNATKLFRMGVPFDTLDERFSLGIGPVPDGTTGFIDFRPLEALTAPIGQRAATGMNESKAAFAQWEQTSINRLRTKGDPGNVFLHPAISQLDSYWLATILGMCQSEAEIKATFTKRLELKEVIGEREEIEPERAELEELFIPIMLAFLLGQVGRILTVVEQTGEQPDAEFWQNENVLMVAAVLTSVESWVDTAVNWVVTNIIRPAGLGTPEAANDLAARWAGRHAATMVRGINRTSRNLARTQISNWLRAGTGDLDLLTNSLTRTIAPRWRAEMIAQTEVTRAWSMATHQVARVTPGVKGLVWLTQRDERVCPICGPLEKKKRSLRIGATYPGGFTGPPAHVRCRCMEALII